MNEAFKTIRLLILDSDGVLTDNRIMVDSRGEVIYSYHVKDGQGLKSLMEAGIEIAIVSGRVSEALRHRARELGIAEVFTGVKDKGAVARELIRKKGFGREEVCCVGDDLPDLDLFREAAVSVAVADAAQEVLSAATFVTKNKGGHGAVREVCEWILKGQGKWFDGTFGRAGEGED
ncbi:MAG: HAD hydrolase family protein [Deltaproteobacteria bacterium]|nr:HAD hydrolase family protein [Deltaproteobacteria bacterium]